VSSACWLDALAKSILNVFAFDDDHLYEFVYKNRYGLTERVVHPFVEGDEPTTDQCRVGDLPLFEGMDFTFHFDFGDDWNFEMMVESLSTGGQDKYPEPTLVEQRGKPPQQYPNWDD
ncbi:MAG: IS1096 element passenger TnpR family protein, partial [Gammaproteobacteria bacterium]